MACFQEAAGARQHYPRELNPVENIWQFIRDNWLSNRVFKSYDDILDHCCFVWNKLTMAFIGLVLLHAPCGEGEGGRTFVGGDVTALGMVAPGLALRELSCSEP
jgi:hypothetical protein